jgi:hypothetical protein
MNSQLSATSRNQIRNRMVKLAGENIRKYQQLTRPVSAIAEINHLAQRRCAAQFLESSDNRLTKSLNRPIPLSDSERRIVR